MQTGLLPFQVTPGALLPSPFNKLIRPVEPLLLRHFMPDALCRGYAASDPVTASAFDFTSQMLRHLDISYEVEAKDLEQIPKTGPCVVVANHPFGLLEGFILVTILEKIRPDYRIVANVLLESTPALHERVIFVNPFEDASANENSRGIRASIDCLRRGGLVVTFPAGEVAHFSWSERSVVDPKWKTSAARLAIKVGCPIVPFFFKGANSLPFQVFGTLHPRLRTINLARELVNKRKGVIELRVGSAISAASLRKYADVQSATDYLRARTYLLENRLRIACKAIASSPENIEQLAKPVAASLAAAEVAALDASCILAFNQDFKVLLAGAEKISNVLLEIGEAREETYRAVGEGTGKSLDLDEFDHYYQHLFLWSNRDQRVAGAYRLVRTPDVLANFGIKGLYTSTLFHYDADFFKHIGPAIEVGRSFIRREYQKHYAPLLLLWKGIAQFAQRHPECPVLFGVVSISSQYQSLSQTLMVQFLSRHLDQTGARLVKPRLRFRGAKLVPKHIRELADLLMNIEDLSSSVEDLECDGRGLPVLIRQYLKLRGNFLGFNVEPAFSNALDALVIADLRTASPAILERCMGEAGAVSFRAFHATAASSLQF